MTRTFKYRIYPTAEQQRKIDASIGVCRLIYNLALEVKIRAYKEHGVGLSAFDLINQLPDLRNEYPWIKNIDSQALQASIRKVEVAFMNFFNGSRYPKFKSKRNGGSFQCPNNTRRINWDEATLTIPKIANIPIVLSKRFEGALKNITISKTTTRKYFASILVEDSRGVIKPQVPSAAVGIDLGISTFITLSTGEKIENQRYLKNSLNRLRVLQRRASKKKKGSNNRRKAQYKVALLHEKIANQRNDFLHKVSTKLIRDNQTDTICVETLAVKNMVKNHKLAQAISDVSWSELVRQLEYKGKWYGKNVVKIDRFYASSKICSNCGHKYDELNLSEREWKCSKCDVIHDRDINAAINIRNSGMGNPGEPVERRIKVRAKKQESRPKE